MAEIVDFGLQQHKIKMDSRYFENVLSVVAGDTGRRLEVQLLDTNGMVQDTTGLSLRLNAEIAGKTTFTDATLVDATTGKYQLDLSNGMFLAPGNWQFQWLITDSAGKKLHSFVFTGNIGKNISEGGSQATNFYLNLEDLKKMQDDLINGTIDSSILETTITEKLTDLETQYAPKLTEVTAQLAQIVTVNVKDFGALGDGVTDDTSGIVSAYNYAVEHSPAEILFPSGIYNYTSLGVLKHSDVGFVSKHEKSVILKCISTTPFHTALEINAFNDITATPILYNFKLKNIIVSGNALTKTGILVQGFSKLDWENVYVSGVGGGGTIAYHLKGVHVSQFKNVSHGNNYTGVQSLNPETVLLVDRSSRGGIIQGSSTNNVFINCQYESSIMGIDLIYADQNTFTACASQGNTTGVTLRQNARYNNFMGVAAEKNSSTIDFEDLGRSNNFFNCYTEFKFKANGSQGNILGGVLSNLILGGLGYMVNGVRVNGRGNDDGGLLVTGDNVVHSVLDLHVNDYVYPLESRKSITPDVSPFKFKNTTHNMIEVIIQSGVVEAVQKTRNGSTFLVSHTVPNTHLLAPNEELKVTYTTTPSMSYIKYNGY